MAKDAKQRQIHKAKLAALGIKSNALENRTGLSSPTSMSALETLSTLEQAKNKVDVFFNESSQFVDWLENHVLLSHDLARDYSSAAETVIKICIPISITTRGTKWKRLEEMLLLTSLLPSLVQTVEPGFHFGVYLGYDVGDPLLDAPGQIEELSKLVDGIVQSASISLKCFRYEDSRNRNVWAVNYITREAYLDGYDYFYRVNDDSAFVSPWAHSLTSRLRETNDFGVVGVYDKQNPRIFTHSMIGRPHLEVFGYHFPFEFGNYWSDDWITFLYLPPFIHKAYDIEVKHHTHAERYSVEHERRKVLDDMVNLGRRRWKAYLCLVRRLGDYCNGREKEYIGTWPDE